MIQATTTTTPKNVRRNTSHTTQGSLALIPTLLIFWALAELFLKREVGNLFFFFFFSLLWLEEKYAEKKEKREYIPFCSKILSFNLISFYL